MPKPAILGLKVCTGASGGGISPASRKDLSSSCLVGSLIGDLLPEPPLNGPGDSCLANNAFESRTDMGAVESSVAGVGELLPAREGGVCWKRSWKSAPIADFVVASFFGVSTLTAWGFCADAGGDASRLFM